MAKFVLTVQPREFIRTEGEASFSFLWCIGLQTLFHNRAVMLTGKGGVGRTTVAAAIARAGADQGLSVLIAEVGEPDVDHSPLGALFGHPTLPKEPVQLEENIFGVMIWARMGHERFLRRVLPIPALVKAALRSGALRRMLDAAPSLNELGVFYHMLSLAREQQGAHPRFDLMVIDLPATGHALGMASLPENILSIIPSGPIHRAMREGMDIFFNPEQAAMYVVTLPEALPITECVELLEGLKETEIPIGGVIVNKVFKDSFSDEERARLRPMMENNEVFGATRYLGITKVKEALNGLKDLVKVPTIQLSEQPVEGMELVDRMAAELAARVQS